MRQIQANDTDLVEAVKAKRKRPVANNQYTYQGSLGQVVDNGRYFFAWKDGVLIGTYNALEKAMESLESPIDLWNRV